MEETTDTPETAGELDLNGVPEPLHELFRVLHASELGDVLESYRVALTRVKAGADGSVIIDLLTETRVGKEDVDRIRLRPIRGRDYVDSRVAACLADGSYDGTIRFAAALVTPKGAVEELADTRDIDAVYLGTVIARGNFFRPKN